MPRIGSPPLVLLTPGGFGGGDWPADTPTAGAAEVAGFTIRRQPLGVDLRGGEVIAGETGAALRLKATAADHLAQIRVIVRSGRSVLRSDPALLRVGRG